MFSDWDPSGHISFLALHTLLGDFIYWLLFKTLGFPGSSVGKESACYAGDPSSIPGLGRSAGEGKSYPLQYSGLENSMDCIVHGVSKSWTRLSDFRFQSLYWAFLVAQTVKNLPVMRETWVQSWVGKIHYCFCFMFWFLACWILAPWLGIQPGAPELEGGVLPLDPGPMVKKVCLPGKSIEWRW